MYKTIASLTLSLLLGLSGYANAHDHMSDDDSAEEMAATDQVSESEDIAGSAADASVDMEDSSDTAAATRFSCSYDNMVRSIEVVYEQPGFTVPCSVVYHKETESPGDIKTLWSADNQAGYCEEKATEFSDKLEGFGWDCQSTGS